MRKSPPIEDYEIYNILVREGMEARAAARLVEFLPLVYTRIALASLDIKFAVFFSRRLPDGRYSAARRFDLEPVWNAAVEFARAEVEGGLAEEELMAVLRRSSDFNVVNKMAGDDLKGTTTETVFLWPEEGPDAEDGPDDTRAAKMAHLESGLPMQRQMNEFELADAKRVLNWQYWAPPLTATLLCLGFLAGFWNEELSHKLFLAVFLGSPALIFWFFFLRYKQRVQRDVDGRIIEVLDGLPEKVLTNGLGMCFVFLGGKRIRVPFEYYEELANATSVTLEYLPESSIALYVRSRRELLIPIWKW
jgi:hypothetical protein